MKNNIILLTSEHLGSGEEELGRSLLENYFTLLKQEDDKPAAIFTINKGVYTLTDRHFASLHLKEMEENGVPILGCKTCIDYYQLSNELVVGEVSSMKAFIDLSKEYSVITL
ncbi:DsrE family protein [Texcoconibacillus texcoconensis]|uniref:Intracellular sulfur oxidation DsrE/DsrF family protein n=1 Tax=Texcoconibacillus texcoconensis TaxID=1095777 RepID=A0A840QQN1_9BACI|nr:DsrE family protein [Texcoconibacillus texcoconensis]MBB5173633.1 intracellular sulfur oxidation DsrE/DsrF family protein [Texcoconibacillus texcoconensis]